MSNVGRVLTLRVTITDHDASKWLWFAYPESKNGIQVTALSNGDMFAERDTLAEAASFYIREDGETTEDAIDAHVDGGYSDPDTAAWNAPVNVSPGAKWDIVDKRGNVLRSSK